MRIIHVALMALLALVVACGGSDDESVDQDAVDAENYDIAYMVCSRVLDGTINDNSGVTADPETNPEAYAFEYAEKMYRPEFRGPVHDGCLDALEGRDKSPPG